MDTIGRERERSLKFVQVVFAALALLSLVSALAVSTRGVDLGLPETSTYPDRAGLSSGRRHRHCSAICLGTHLPTHRTLKRALAGLEVALTDRGDSGRFALRAGI